MNIVVVLLLIFVMVGFNALYVAAEFATVGARRSRVQETAETGSGPATGLLVILRDPKRLDNYVAACQIGITLSSIVAGAYGQAQLVPLFEERFGSASRTIAVVVVLLFITGLQVVLGELLPKTVALRYPENVGDCHAHADADQPMAVASRSSPSSTDPPLPSCGGSGSTSTTPTPTCTRRQSLRACTGTVRSAG